MYFYLDTLTSNVLSIYELYMIYIYIYIYDLYIFKTSLKNELD